MGCVCLSKVKPIYFFLIPLLLLGCAKKKGTNHDGNPPPFSPAVNLYPPSHITGRSLLISWSPYRGSDFKSYLLYRSTTTQVDTTSPLLHTDTTAYDTTFCDKGLAEGVRYYYRVYVAGADSLLGASDPTSALTKGGDYCFYLQMGDGSGLPGGVVTIPLTLIRCAPVAGYTAVLKWENLPVDSFHIEQGGYFVDGSRFYFDSFSVHLESVDDSTKVIVFGMAGNSPPMRASEEADTLALFTFWLSPDWDGLPIHLGFFTEFPYRENTISDPAATLYCASSAYPANTCPPNPAIKLYDGEITLQP